MVTSAATAVTSPVSSAFRVRARRLVLRMPIKKNLPFGSAVAGGPPHDAIRRPDGHVDHLVGTVRDASELVVNPDGSQERNHGAA